jgi:hypothetical protein
MTRLDLFSQIGKQYFIYSQDINEIATLAKSTNTIYTFSIEESVFFGFFKELDLETLIKVEENTSLVLSSGKDAHNKVVAITKNNISTTVYLENLFMPTLSINKSNEKPTDKLEIQVSFSKAESISHQCVLVPTESLVKAALNLKHYQFQSIIHCPVTINNTEFSFMRYYNFLFNMKNVINLAKHHDYYIDVNYITNQKIFFSKREATYIILPSENQIIRFNESPRFLQEMVKFKKQKTIKFFGLNGSLFNDIINFKEEQSVCVKETLNTKESVFKPEPIEKSATITPVKNKTKKKKEIVADLIEVVKQEKKEEDVISMFSIGGLTNKLKIEALIEYAIASKNHSLFTWACVRYITFHPKYAKQKEEYIVEQYKLVFERTMFNMSFNQRMLEYNPNIFTRFINKSRKALVNKDILKFTKDKEGLMSSVSDNKLKEDDYPKEIIASLYSGGNNSSSNDENIDNVTEVIKSKVKKLSNIHIMIDHFADYARYLNGTEIVNKNIDIKSTVFFDESKTNTETAYAHAIMILLNCARQSGYGFSYTQNFELTIKLEEFTKKLLSDKSRNTLANIVREYISSDFSSWFKTNKKLSIESIVNDQGFINMLNSTNQFSIHEMIPNIIKKIEDQSFVFKKSSIIEVTVNKLLSSNSQIAANSFALYLSKDTEGNSTTINLLRFIRKASLFILSDVFDLNFLDNAEICNDFVSLLMESLKTNSDTIKYYYSFMNKFSRYMKDKSKTKLYKEFTNSFIAYLLIANNNQDKINLINCIAECISGTISCNKSEDSIAVLREVLKNLNNEQKAILLNKIAKKAYIANNDFKEYFINECLSLITEFEKNRDTKEKVIAYYSMLESIFGIYVKDTSEEESRRDIFFAREEDAYCKRINEIEYFVNSNAFNETVFDDTTIQEVL